MRYGLIAGNGKFPFLVVEGAKKQNAFLSVVAIKEETDPQIERVADRVQWVGIGQLGKMIAFFKNEGVTRAMMAGQVKHVQIFSGALPDLRMLRMLFNLKQRNTDSTTDDGKRLVGAGNSRFGQFDTKQKNAIWAFTPGELTFTGWYSEKSPNVEQLVYQGSEFERAIKRSKNRMTLAVPDWVKNINYKKGVTMNKFFIHFYDRTNVSVNPTPWRSITFHQIFIVDNKPLDFSKIPKMNSASAKYSEVLVEIRNGADFPRQ